MLCKTQRVNWEEYRVSRIPNGTYLLTVRFQEQRVHGPGFSVFDLAAEGQTLADRLDLYAQAGRYYALDRRFAITVADGELNLVATPSVGETTLAALELAPRAPDLTAPAVPSGLGATASYSAVLLDWADNGEDDVAGYHVYRADQPKGPCSRLTADEPDYLSRYKDMVAAGVVHYYRVTAVDVYGNESGPCGTVSASAIDASEARLSLCELHVSPEDLAILEADPFRDTRVPGAFTWQGQTLDVEVRFRGKAGRTYPKKSWKIVFEDGQSPFPNHDRINMNANWGDVALLRAKLATDLFSAAGLHPPEAELVLLTLNGDYRGVYTRVEQVDEGFLASSGRNPGASVYKVVDRFGEILPDEESYRAFYEKGTNGEGSLLRSRVLAVPEFRATFCDRLAVYMDTIFSAAVLVPRMSALHYAIQADGVRDWRKLGWEDSSDFLDSPGYIGSYVRLRWDFLWGEMQSFCSGE